MCFLTEKLKNEPTNGIRLGHNCYKLRISIKSKSKGKSAGARLIYYIHVSAKDVHLISIYDKSEIENITNNEIMSIVNSLNY